MRELPGDSESRGNPAGPNNRVSRRRGARRLMRSVRLTMKRRLLKALLWLLPLWALYWASWHWSGELGITHPMANLRYFYYGSNPGSFSDSVLYWAYYIPYRIHIAHEDFKDQGRDFVHWSDRRD